MAHAAKLLGIPAWIVVPESVPLTKLTAIQRTGAEAIVEGVTGLLVFAVGFLVSFFLPEPPREGTA